MSPPSLAQLTDLPHELLSQIINPLDDESIYAFTQTCKTFHFFALPLVLSRNGIRIIGPDLVSIIGPSEEGLIALRTSLFAPSLQRVHFYPSAEECRLFFDLRMLQMLLLRLPLISHLTVLYPSYQGVVDSRFQGALLDMQKWSVELAALMDTALQKSCRDLQIYGGDNLFADPDELESQEWPALKFKALSATASRKISSFFFFSRVTHLPKTSHSPSRSRLSSLYINSPMLLHPYLFRWTQSRLQTNTRSLTHLRFHDVRSSTWHQLLATLTLPSLCLFDIVTTHQLVGGSGVALGDIHTFLKRHPSIKVLNLSGINFPKPTPKLRNPIPTRLRAVGTHPKIIAWLLRGTAAHLKELKEVTITSEPGDFGYDQFDEALEAVALCSRMDAIHLHFNFVSKTGLHKWFEKHLSNPTAPSDVVGCIGNLTRVTHLTVRTRHWMKMDDRDEPVVQAFRLCSRAWRKLIWRNNFSLLKTLS
ncbi:uncharacterized protein LACBIDRAFT_330126 [Laccaria bicolor S238N-H82]|uniref:Predicted protein n=1 Tax=Laccaria bicolor (strain S238N-H82 / ATCC MYA-4686) TaxID=486041 RepID=B0DKD8_LACBS|nr:uncharacterized protein LACBIDRAFT_330126 [Laccaria bicolor S238N-H82]EDR05050.1 predicted protein [Laccaria bicolor S238N-H82]|eukprot:XP_001884440.1 predicted protein [Laccaria bicolor S238N-H82]